jgi:retron-type reverse transcriptase
MHDKNRSNTKGGILSQDGVEFPSIARNAKSFSKAMAKDVREGKYKMDPARHVTIVTKGKERILYKYKVTDMILHGVVAHVLATEMESKFSENLHSYRKGKNYWQAIRSFSKYSREHFKRKIDPKKKGFYVLRRDIASYTDNIPVDENSPLWPLLKEELKFPENPTNEDNIVWDYVEKVVRTDVILPGSREAHTQTLGVPTGSPISTTVYNLYLINLDRTLDSLNLGFYARYGDDLMIADTSLEKIVKANEIFKETLSKYQLTSSPKKEKSFFFNIAGRAPLDPNASLQGFVGCDRIEFLGCDIMARGEISLDRKKEKELLQNLENRMRLALINDPLGQSEEIISSRLKTSTKIVRSALDPDSLLCQKSAPALRNLITDRRCLKRIDFNISKLILKYVLGDYSIKGFRRVPIKRMRKEGLPSLVHQRNLVGRK